MAERASVGSGIRVLLLDDSPIALEFQQMLLERYGFEVRTCSALSDLDGCDVDWHPHVIVSDVDLPDACDVDVLSALSTHAVTAGAPVVLCSGLPLDELERLRDERGAAGCVSKSENIRDLPQVLRRLCQP
jgi:response regulator RpfG family c-di-GMP phosphodiesterase